MNKHERRHYRELLGPLAIIFSIVLLGPLAIDVYLPSVPEMIRVFSSTDSEMRQTISIYVLALGVSQLVAGPVSDRYGRRASAVLGTAIYAIGSLVAVVATGMEVLYLARALQGFGAAFTMVTAMAWIRDHFEGNEAGRLLSYMGGVISTIPTIAPLIGSGLAFYWGWVGGFYAMAGLAILLTVLSAVLLGSQPKIAQSERGAQSKRESNQHEALGCNIRAIFSNTHFRTFALANTLSFAGLLTYVAVAPVIAMEQGSMTTVEFSLVFGLIGGAQVLTSLSAPKVMYRVGRPKTVLLGSSFVLLAGAGLVLIPEGVMSGFFILAGVASAGFSLLSGAATSLALEPFRYCAGLAASIDGFLRMVGGALLVAISSLVPLTGQRTLALVYLLSVIAVFMLWRYLKTLVENEA
ncbi:multidrug effflux MFS transporter [Vibrio sp. SM6]|uniref:Multidrug effflux MFS transporter n=1 Tax=Vibrio agarilyticus TaxID=2726741 RepID=A0A7X8TRI9_9VIBR|nr:multidrug effflux MFS transporter [Vibrio agarilyticus]NLS12898.1 multidrug effflux MFS transporter [Vibrio agarilyticus]